MSKKKNSNIVIKKKILKKIYKVREIVERNFLYIYLLLILLIINTYIYFHYFLFFIYINFDIIHFI